MRETLNIPEYRILHKFFNEDHQKLTVPLDVIRNILMYNAGYELINLDLIKNQIDETFRCLVIKQRFILLSELINGALQYDDFGFTVGEHRFQTLDEVERAIKNKAFL